MKLGVFSIGEIALLVLAAIPLAVHWGKMLNWHRIFCFILFVLTVLICMNS